MIVCHCSVVSDRTLRSAASEGARTVSAVCRATGAGQSCGTCVFAVKAVLQEQGREEHTNGHLADHLVGHGCVEVDGAAS